MDTSNISVGKVTFEERKRNLDFLRVLYTLFAIGLLIAVIWTSFAITYFDEFGHGIKACWEVANLTGIL